MSEPEPERLEARSCLREESEGRQVKYIIIASYRPVNRGFELDIRESAGGNDQVPTYDME